MPVRVRVVLVGSTVGTDDGPCKGGTWVEAVPPLLLFKNLAVTPVVVPTTMAKANPARIKQRTYNVAFA